MKGLQTKLFFLNNKSHNIFQLGKYIVSAPSQNNFQHTYVRNHNKQKRSTKMNPSILLLLSVAPFKHYDECFNAPFS